MQLALKNLLMPPAQALSVMRRAWRLHGNTLVLRLPPGWPEEGGVISWWLHGDQGLILRGQIKDLKELPGEVAAAPALVWTPAADTLLTSADLPTRSRSKIQQALPYALEDQLLGDPEALHFVHSRQDGGRLAVAVTARARLRAWREALRAGGLHPVILAPVTLAAPLTPGDWSLSFAPDQTCLRTGPYSGIACPPACATHADRQAGPAEPPPMLQTALAEAKRKNNAPRAIAVFAPPAGFDADAWTRVLEVPVSVQKQDYWIERGVATAPINLLQGEFAPAGQARQMLGALRPAAIMLALWLVGSLSFTFWEWRQLSTTRETTRQEMHDLFRRTFPEAKAIVDPALQMQRILDELQGRRGKIGAGDLLPLLSDIAPAVQAHSAIKLRSMQYGDASLTIDLSVTDFQSLEGLKNALAARGMQVEVLGANSGASGVDGRLRVRRLPARGAQAGAGGAPS